MMVSHEYKTVFKILKNGPVEFTICSMEVPKLFYSLTASLNLNLLLVLIIIMNRSLYKLFMSCKGMFQP